LKIFKTNRKVQVFGSSLAVTLPALFVKVRDIGKGSNLEIIYGLNGALVISDKVEPDVLRAWLRFILQKLDNEKLKDMENGERSTSTIGKEVRK
jgi:antitoxin component of MazEF toxin-antitoxin module